MWTMIKTKLKFHLHKIANNRVYTINVRFYMNTKNMSLDGAYW